MLSCPVVNEISYKLNWVKSMHLKFWEKMHLPSNKNGKLSN